METWLYLYTRVSERKEVFRAYVLDIEHLFDWEDDVFDLWHTVVLQDFGIWHGNINTRHPGDRSIQVVEGGAWAERQRNNAFYDTNRGAVGWTCTLRAFGGLVTVTMSNTLTIH